MRTYSTYYDKHAIEMPDYGARYRKFEHPDMTDVEFLAAHEYEIVLRNFRARFGIPSRRRWANRSHQVLARLSLQQPH
jgi:hypothetical protein